MAEEILARIVVDQPGVLGLGTDSNKGGVPGVSNLLSGVAGISKIATGVGLGIAALA